MSDIGGQLRSWWMLLEDALGVTLSRVSHWIGPSIAALWFWSGDGGDRLGQNTLFPSESPLAWVQRVLTAAGIDASWPAQAAHWLDQRGSLDLVWSVAAVLLASYSVTSSETRGLVNPATLCLLTAMQVGDPMRAWTWFYCATLAICVGVLSWDSCNRDVRDELGTDRTIPAIAIPKWAAGPGWVAFGMMIIPALLIRSAFSAYRHQPPFTAVMPTGAAMDELDTPRRAADPLRRPT